MYPLGWIGGREDRHLLLTLLLSGEVGRGELRRLLASAERTELRRLEEGLQSWLEAVRDEIGALDGDGDDATGEADGFYDTAGSWHAPAVPKPPAPKPPRPPRSPQRQRRRS